MKFSAWRYYGNYYRASWRVLALVVTVAAGQSLLLVPTTWLVREGFDSAIPSGSFSQLMRVGGAILLLQLLSHAVTIGVRYCTLKITKQAIQAVRDELLQRLFCLSRAYHTTADRGQLHNLIIQETERLDIMSNALVTQLLPAVVTSSVLALVLFWLNKNLFLVLVVVAPLPIFINRWIGPKIKARVKDYHQSFAAFGQGMLSILQRFELTRLQTAEQIEIARQQNIHDEFRQSGIATWAWFTAYGLLQDVVLILASVMILMIGGRAVAHGEMTVGMLLSFYFAVALLGNQLRAVWATIPQLIAGNEALGALQQWLTETETAFTTYQGTKAITFGGKISFAAVSFGYGEQAVLQNISLTLEPATMCLILGPNGAGKSTLLNLILGFYQPQQGQLYADEQPYGELNLIALRRAMGVVSQNPDLFPGTVWENLTYGCPAATRVQVTQAATMAIAHAFIEQLPQGYETFIGEQGVLLSGGQRQRLALARALLRQPKLLILDEPTNHLDTETVRQIWHNLRSNAATPTLVIVTHNAENFPEAEVVFRLPEGKCLPRYASSARSLAS